MIHKTEAMRIVPWYKSKTLIAILIAGVTAISPLVTDAVEKGRVETKDVVAIISAASLACLGAYSRLLPGNIATGDGIPGLPLEDVDGVLIRQVEPPQE